MSLHPRRPARCPPAASQLGSTRVGGIDVNKPRSRAALAAALALAIAPGGFTVADFTTKVRAINGQAGDTIRNAAYDLRKFRGKHLADKTRPHPPVPDLTRCRPYHQRPAHPPGTRHRAPPRRRRRPADLPDPPP